MLKFLFVTASERESPSSSTGRYARAVRAETKFETALRARETAPADMGEGSERHKSAQGGGGGTGFGEEEEGGVERDVEEEEGEGSAGGGFLRDGGPREVLGGGGLDWACEEPRGGGVLPSQRTRPRMVTATGLRRAKGRREEGGRWKRLLGRGGGVRIGAPAPRTGLGGWRWRPTRRGTKRRRLQLKNGLKYSLRRAA
jgi:hypothetical protein